MLLESYHNLSFPNTQPHLRVADSVNTDEALVTEYRRDNLTNCCGGNAIDIQVFVEVAA